MMIYKIKAELLTTISLLMFFAESLTRIVLFTSKCSIILVSCALIILVSEKKTPFSFSLFLSFNFLCLNLIGEIPINLTKKSTEQLLLASDLL